MTGYVGIGVHPCLSPDFFLGLGKASFATGILGWGRVDPMYAIDTGGTLEYRDKKKLYTIQNSKCLLFFQQMTPCRCICNFCDIPYYNKGFLRRISRSHISTNISFFQPNQKNDRPPPNPTPSTQIFSKPLCQVTRNEIGSALHWPRSVQRKFCHSQEVPKELRKVNDHLVPLKNVSRIFATQIVGCGAFIVL